MLRILYVTALWDGLADVLYRGVEPCGMPAFIRPLRALVERGDQVDLFVGTPVRSSRHSGAGWFESIRVYERRWVPGHSAGTLMSLLSFEQSLLRHLGRTRYDFVYGHGPLGTAGVIAARRFSIPCGQRLYGTFMSRDIAAPRPSAWRRWRAFLRHPLEYMAYSLPKSFLLITNDGSRGNLVFQAIGHQRTDLHFWLNGAEREPQDARPVELPFPHGTPYLLYPARIEPWKQQHLAIELLRTLKSELGITLRLVFAGHEDDAAYARQLLAAADRGGVADLVASLGPVPLSSMPALYAGSLAVLSFYSVCNLGNVAIEALSSGCALLSLDDGSLDGIVSHGSSGFLVSEMRQAVAIVAQLLADPGLRERIGQGARQSSREHFLPWEERVAREIALIDGAVAAAHGRAHA